ncbi:hypothetical protein L6164_016543 [Bauhinia variegata]|uniref:Uncharacterized protein n=1 Tax=Bauhinia variegata TaxID=167791 RepID=A0ACB9NRZ9_BAUVA|nr:hypothetical protein L6164_016543 [Bauhinia variegata]
MPKRSWSQSLAGNIDPGNGLNLHYLPSIELGVVNFTQEDVTEEINYWNLSLIGIVVGLRISFSMLDAYVTRSGICLVTPITKDKIKAALFSIGNNKAPGLNDFNSYFYKKAWPIVGETVEAAIRDFFEKGTFLQKINATVIALIPKGENSSKVKDTYLLLQYHL